MDKSLIYRDGDPADGFYPMTWSFFGYWSCGQPGFSDTTDPAYGFDPSVRLSGTPNVDYQIWFEILDLPPSDFRIKMDDGTGFTEVGQGYNLSDRIEHHVHMKYRAYVPQEPPPTGVFYVTFKLVDALGMYEDSEPFICVFNVPAPAVEETTPLYRAVLPNTYTAPMRFTFHRAIMVDGGPPVTITDQETQAEDYYAGYFDYEVSVDDMTLILNRTGRPLPAESWLQVSLTEHLKDANLTDRPAVPFTHYVRTPAPGDMDGDDYVDLRDFATFALCYGSEVSDPLPGCSAEEAAAGDMDGDGLLDLLDFASFALVFGS